MKKAGSETPVNISQSLVDAGVIEHHESNEMAEIDGLHGGLLSSSKAAVPASTEHKGLVTIPKPITHPKGKPMEDTTWGIVPMARKLFEQSKKKGEMKNAA